MMLSLIPSHLKIALLAGLFTFCWSGTPARAQQSGADRISGVWLTQNGRSKRQKPLVGTEVLHGFGYDGKGAWTGGKIYAPEKGLLLDAKLTLPDPGTLVLQVSAGITTRKITWTRAVPGE